ncbi:unnamed protein product, partial [Phaeothamnion confervicola]
MAGTRLLAHASFLVGVLLIALAGWQSALTSRSELPLEDLSALLRAEECSAGQQQGACHESSQVASPSAHSFPVSVDLLLLADPSQDVGGRAGGGEGGCGCGALLQAFAADDAAARAAFEAALLAAGAGRVRLGDLRRHVVRADLGSAARLLLSANGPAALDDWLRDLLPQSPIMTVSEAAAAPPPRYAFFVACGGRGTDAARPNFVMGKRRHGLLILPPPTCVEGTPESTETETTIEAAAAAAAALGLSALAGLAASSVLAPPLQLDGAHARTATTFRLRFSLLIEDPALRRCAWNFPELSRKFLAPLLRKLSPLASFSIASRELQYVHLPAEAVAAASPATGGTSGGGGASGGYVVAAADLRDFLVENLGMFVLGLVPVRTTVADAAATANITTAAAGQHQEQLEFVVICPAPAHSPLLFAADGGAESAGAAAAAFEMSGFGVVAAADITAADSDSSGGGDELSGAQLVPLRADAFAAPMGAFVTHIRHVVGLETVMGAASGMTAGAAAGSRTGEAAGAAASAAAAATFTAEADAFFLPSPTDGLTDWEADALVRSWTLEHRQTAIRLLRAAAVLATTPPAIAFSVVAAADAVAALEALVALDVELQRTTMERTGSSSGIGTDTDCPDLVRATALAGEARAAAERLDADAASVPRPHFPTEHLMAVFLPLLAPLVIPLLFGFAREVRRCRQK